MIQVGDRVRVKSVVGGPDVARRLADYRLRLWGLTGTVVDIVPQIERPVVVAFADPAVPGRVRFWGCDLEVVT